MPDGHKSLILDKSAFRSLSRQEHARAAFGFTSNVTPVLLREILTDLTKEDPKLRLKPDECVQLLARKFLGSGGCINVECRKLCVGDLAGQPVPGDGRVLIEDFSYVTDPSDPNGPPAIWIEPGKGNMDILRWARAEFSAHPILLTHEGEAARVPDTWAGSPSPGRLHARERRRCADRRDDATGGEPERLKHLA